ncbi:MAG TPA: alkaline phosphatase family protein [Thermoanaerobaculia bacterium]|nr:alkaline phosphatase family protein [Thermoanaerobaculia bacterium]
MSDRRPLPYLRHFRHLRKTAFRAALLLVLLGAAAGWLGCRPDRRPEDRRPRFLVVGIDGGEWRVIRALWAEGKLPHLRGLADRGVAGTLRTAYNSSPVIWTTIATGVNPPEHGITDFVVATPQGDVPISSTVRKVPALWNMLTRAKRRVSVFGWWGSWPAEEINGVMVTDRALIDLPGRVSPESYLPAFLENVEAAKAEPGLFQTEWEPELRDLALTRSAERLVREDGHDLLLVYFRGPDMVSHNYWKYYEPEAFSRVDPVELARYKGRVPQVYEAVDQEIGRLLEAVPEDTNVLVISDHGFHAAKDEEVKVLLDMDKVLERLGYLARSSGSNPAIDFSRTRFYAYATPPHRRAKLIRFSLAGREEGGTVRPEERAALRQALAADLATVTYAGGAPVFYVRNARPREVEEGADFVVGVSPEGATPVLLVKGERFEGAIESVSRISGTHTQNTHGILIAAGPDIDPAAQLDGIRIHDITPTLLYGLGLPVAEDFAGKPWTALFTPELRQRQPQRTIRSWGKREQGGAVSISPADEKLLDELRSLGYIN